MSRQSSVCAALYHGGRSMKHYIPLHHHNLRPHFLPTPTRDLSLFLFSIHSRSYEHKSAPYCAMRVGTEKYIYHKPFNNHTSDHIHVTTGHIPPPCILKLTSKSRLTRAIQSFRSCTAILASTRGFSYIDLTQSIDSRTSLHHSFSQHEASSTTPMKT